MDVSKCLVEAQHHVTVNNLVLAILQCVSIAILSVGREDVSILCAVHVLNLIRCQVGSDTCTQSQSRDNLPCWVDATDETLVILDLLLTQDIPEVLANQRCRTHWGVEELFVGSQCVGGTAVSCINAIHIAQAGHGVLTDVLNICEATEHTRVVLDDTADTIRTVLDVLLLISSGVVQLDGIGDIECTIQVEVVLVVCRVILHGLRIVEVVREADVATLRAVGDGYVVVLVETSAEYLVPLVATDRCVWTLGTIEIGYLSAIVAWTIRIITSLCRCNNRISISIESRCVETC